jgi:hypothetical protein
VRHAEPAGHVTEAEGAGPVLGDGAHGLLDGRVPQIPVVVGTAGLRATHALRIREHLYTARFAPDPPRRTADPVGRVDGPRAGENLLRIRRQRRVTKLQHVRAR